jgi:hypothetical protein
MFYFSFSASFQTSLEYQSSSQQAKYTCLDMAYKSRFAKEGKFLVALKQKSAKMTKSRAKQSIPTLKSRYSERLTKWAAQVTKTKALILGTPTTAKRIANTTSGNTGRERTSELDVLETKTSAKTMRLKKGTRTKVVRSSKTTPARLGIKCYQKAVANLSFKNKLAGRPNGQAQRKIRKLRKVTAALSAQRETACLSSIAYELEELESGYMRMMKTPKDLVEV